MKRQFFCAALCLGAVLVCGPLSASAAQIDVLGFGGLKDGGSCACIGPISPTVEDMVTHSAGNSGFLRQSVRSAVLADVMIAQDVICLARNSAPDVKAALAIGLLDAQKAIGFTDPTASDEIIAWVRCADEAFQSVYFSTPVDKVLVPRSIDGGFTGGVVSPSKP